MLPGTKQIVQAQSPHKAGSSVPGEAQSAVSCEVPGPVTVKDVGRERTGKQLDIGPARETGSNQQRNVQFGTRFKSLREHASVTALISGAALVVVVVVSN